MPAVLIAYNTDYDEELKEQSGADVSAVEEAARAVVDAAAAYGFDSSIYGVQGRRDLAGFVDRLATEPPDLVFNLVESLSGDTRNEQLVPSLLDLYGIPYTGPSALAIGTCLHKERCKHVLGGHSIPTPDWLLVESIAALEQIDFDLDFPYFLKLSREDASIGIEASNRVESADAFRKRAQELLGAYKQPVLAERYVDGREVNVTLLGNGDSLEVLPLHEIDFAAMPAGRPNIVSYAAKWDESHVDYEGTKPVPMRNVAPETAAAIGEVAKDTFRALGLRDFGRVDLRVDSDGRPWVIDVNPNCDLSPDAGVARTALAAGLDYPNLIGRVCEIAWSRHGIEYSKA